MKDARTVRTHPAGIAILVLLAGVAAHRMVGAQGVQPPREAKAPPLPPAPAPVGVVNGLVPDTLAASMTAGARPLSTRLSEPR